MLNGDYSDITIRFDAVAGLIAQKGAVQEEVFKVKLTTGVTVDVAGKLCNVVEDTTIPVPKRYAILVDGIQRMDSNSLVGERLGAAFAQGLDPARVRWYDAVERKWLKVEV